MGGWWAPLTVHPLSHHNYFDCRNSNVFPVENWLIRLIGLIHSVKGVQWNQSIRR